MQSQSVQCSNNTKTNSKVQLNKPKKPPKPRKWCLIVYGNIAIILGLSLLIFEATIMNYIAEKILDLRSDSFVFNTWQHYPMKIPLSVKFFNWTNHEDFFNRSVKPKFEEIGPYIFLQDMERIDIVQNDNNNTITFKQLRTFEYDNNIPDNGNLSDRIITINYFTMFMGHFLKDWHTAVKDVYSEYISTLNPYYYFDTTIDNELLKGSNNLLIELSNYFDFIVPEFPRWDGFGWLKYRHGEPNFEGIYNIQNGVNRQFDVVSWNYHNTTPYYDEPCGKIKGSIGDLHSAPLNKEFIIVFAAEVCRYITFYFEKEVIIDGVLGYKYSFTKLSLDNGTLNPENKCFCDEPCLPSGVISVASCRYNLNAYLSLPHYYNADPFYLEPFEGLNPEKETHEAYIVVEPNSLLCLEFKIATQINMVLYPVEGISFFDDFPTSYFPIFWMEMKTQLPHQVQKYLKMYLTVPYVIIVASIILITLGICVSCFGVYKFTQFRTLQKSQNLNHDLIDEQIPLNH